MCKDTRTHAAAFLCHSAVVGMVSEVLWPILQQLVGSDLSQSKANCNSSRSSRVPMICEAFAWL